MHGVNAAGWWAGLIGFHPVYAAGACEGKI